MYNNCIISFYIDYHFKNVDILFKKLFYSSKALKMRNGEKIIDRLEFIEDTKGNSGDKGVLVITNLRTIWHSMTLAKISLCEKITQ